MVKNENLKFVCLLNSFVYLSGGDIRFVEIFKRFNQKVTVITPKIGESFCRNNKLNAVYYQTTQETVPQRIVAMYIMRIFKAVMLMSKNDLSGDVIYGTSDCLPDVLPCFITRLRNKNMRWVQLVHHIVPTRKPDSLSSHIQNLMSFWSQRIGFFFMKNCCDLIITINPAVKKELEEMGFNAGIIRVNSNGIDLDYIKEITAGKEIGYDGVFVGRLHPSKGLFDLIAIWELLCKKRPARLAIIGTGDKRIVDRLRKEIEIRGLGGQVDLLGFVESDRKYAIMKSSKLFVFPSREEGFGIVILEAMACKLPVVAYDLSTFDRIYGESILKIPLGDYSRFVETLIHFLADGDSRTEVGFKGFTFVQNYDWDKVSKEELRLLKDLRA